MKRLSLPKKQGGLNLPLTSEVFSQSKAILLVKSFSPRYQNVLWKNNLRKLSFDFYVNKVDLQSHPLYVPKTFNMKKKPTQKFNCWNSEAMKAYSSLQVTPSFKSENSIHASKQVGGGNMWRNDKKQHPNSIPVHARSSRKSGRCTKIGMWNKTKVSFEGIDLDKKIRISTIRKATKKETILTSEQKRWKNQLKIPLEKLFSVIPNTIGRIKDFYQKSIRQYFKSKDGRCDLCGKGFNSFHLFVDCEKVDKLLKLMDPQGTLAEIYKKAAFDPSSKLFTYAWIVFWAIWKTRNHFCHSICNDQIDKELLEASLSFYFKQSLKHSEQEHLMHHYIRGSLKQEGNEHFKFYKVSNNTFELNKNLSFSSFCS